MRSSYSVKQLVFMKGGGFGAPGKLFGADDRGARALPYSLQQRTGAAFHPMNEQRQNRLLYFADLILYGKAFFPYNGCRKWGFLSLF